MDNVMQAMRVWAIENNLEKEFTEEILNNEHFAVWVAKDALVKRFGYFVLEHTVSDVLYPNYLNN